jgi:hypothetical protein
MKYKNKFILLLLFLLMILGCKKENQDTITSNTGPSIIGLWEIKLLTITHYDGSDNILKIDTVKYTDDLGEPVTMLEQFTSDHKFIQYVNSMNNVSFSTTYIQTGNNIKINLSDNVFLFNNRTITKVDSLSLELYEIFNNPGAKEKWIQKYSRK